MKVNLMTLKDNIVFNLVSIVVFDKSIEENEPVLKRGGKVFNLILVKLLIAVFRQIHCLYS